MTTDPLEICPQCKNPEAVFNGTFGFYQCDCGSVWGKSADDPDYEDAELCPACEGYGEVEQHNDFVGCEVCDGFGVI